MNRPTITCITPVFNEAKGLHSYEREIARVLLADDSREWRVLFVDDGSTDSSWEIIQEICLRNPRVSGIRLSRNFGSHLAISAGLEAITSDAAVVLAADLQDPPETVLQFAAKWQSGAKIVWGRRRTRGDQKWRVLCSLLFFYMLRRFAMPRGSKFTTGSFLLMDKKVIEAVKAFPEQNRITFAIVAWTGFDQEVVEYDRAARLIGKSNWSLGRMLKTMYDAFIGFSALPVQLITMLGLGTCAMSSLLGVYFFLAWLLGQPLPGWTSTMLMLSLFFGVQFMILGLMGEYLARIHGEVMRRPLYFISEETPPHDAPPKR